MEINLNRYSNNIITNTPIDVISAWVSCCGKNVSKEQILENREKIINYLENYNYQLPPNENYYSNDDFVKLANFVSSKSCQWNRNNLSRALKHILVYNERLELTFPINYGNKNNNNIFCYDIIMLYDYCIENNIQLNIDDNIDNLVEKINKRQREDNITKEDCLEILSDNMVDCDKKSLLDMMEFLPSCEKKEKVEKVEKVESRPLLSVDEIKSNININYMISRSQLDENEALVYGAKFLCLNLFDSNNKVEELLEFNRCKIQDINYKPLYEDKFGKNYNLNKYYYNIEYFWHPEIENLYPQKNIVNLFKNEGLNDNNNEELEENMKVKNFYIGILPEEDITTFSNTENLISYGLRNSNKIKTIHIKELLNHFNNKDKLIDFEGNNINKRAINKLKAICKLFNKDYFIELLEKIEKIESREKLTSDNNIEDKEKIVSIDNNVLDEFRNKYLFASDQIDRLFDEIFFISMYIRGWKINNQYDYPLKLENSIQKINNKIEDNINNSIAKFKQIINRIADKSIVNLFYKLPIVNYENNNFSFDEQLIYEKIIELSNNLNNETLVHNCGNKLSYSAYYYMENLAYKKLFNIRNFEEF